jgi:outer membrane protein assembly factor BamD (BamD/ComL family)
MNGTNALEAKRQGGSARLRFLLVCVVITPILVCGWSTLSGASSQSSSFKEANDLFSEGNYAASLSKYEEIIRQHPSAADRALFEMGIIYAYPSNAQKDYGKAVECFQRILKDFPESRYRRDAAEMISHINNVTIGEKKLLEQQAQIATLEQEAKIRESENRALQKRVEALEQETKSKESVNAALQEKIGGLERELKNMVLMSQKGLVSKVLVEKGERRLSLLSKGNVLRSYKIALGGDPIGPKERQGDNRTPEGTYIIDSRNRDSGYHLSLHISYPNERDVKRAKALGVSPGGNIMIHGLKNGFSWVGDSHAESDWTRGCIAVTDEEIEEIATLVPIGTTIEIRP